MKTANSLLNPVSTISNGSDRNPNEWGGKDKANYLKWDAVGIRAGTGYTSNHIVLTVIQDVFFWPKNKQLIFQGGSSHNHSGCSATGGRIGRIIIESCDLWGSMDGYSIDVR